MTATLEFTWNGRPLTATCYPDGWACPSLSAVRALNEAADPRSVQTWEGFPVNVAVDRAAKALGGTPHPAPVPPPDDDVCY